MDPQARELRPTDVLFIPRAGRLLHETVLGADGQRVLTLYYDDKEITFDEPALIPFGERLVKETRFVAERALSWSEDGYVWETLAELFDALIGEGILQVEDVASTPDSSAVDAVDSPERSRRSGDGTHVNPTAPSSSFNGRAWSPETCVALTTEIFGVPVEAGNLESLIRPSRIAHPALDVGGRQVGERNVYPTELRLELRTQVRTCPYRGSRFEHERPMNLTGLEPVQKHWKDVLRNLQALKHEFFRRRPAARDGLTVVDLYVLATTVLTIPVFLMHRAKDTVANGHLPLEISALFRMMDGTRITTRDMLSTLHPSFGPEVVPLAEKFFHYADREQLLLAERGVCAGPPAMIETFLTAMTSVEEDGEAPTVTPTSLIGDVQAAASYGITACELESILDQFWLRHAVIMERLLAHLEARPAKHPLEQALQARLMAAFDDDSVVYRSVHPDVSREEVHGNFAKIIEACHHLRARPGEPTILPFHDGLTVAASGVRALHSTLRVELADLPAETSMEIALAVLRVRRLEEQTFPRIAECQSECNSILGRSPPSREYDEVVMARAWARASLRAALAETLGITLGPRTDGSVTVNRHGDRGV